MGAVERASSIFSSSDLRRVTLITDTLLFTLVPVIIIIISNIIIFTMMRRSGLPSLPTHHNQQTPRQKNIQQGKQLTRSLILVSTLFIIVTSPLTFINFLGYYHDSKIYHFNLLHYIFRILNVSNSAINFYLYAFSGRSFREKLKKRICQG